MTAFDQNMAYRSDEAVRLLDGMGRDRLYFDEVTVADHGLQAATQAVEEGVGPDLVVAALFHDIGHLIERLGTAPLHEGIDTRHENLSARYLARWFGPAVTEPVRLHVAAKRYLCAVEPAYLETLSRVSVHSLAVQGGPFSPEAAARFLAQPFAAEAVRLRRWDDAAKIEGARTMSLSELMPRLEACLRGASG